jgi:lipopolysaccharide export LptBFGC system permease protein LptF
MAGIAVGFTLLISSGVASALGEVGLIRPVLAGWGPTVALAAIVLGLAMRDGWTRSRRAVPG